MTEIKPFRTWSPGQPLPPPSKNKKVQEYWRRKQELPYGRYLLADGGYVFFNRSYQPILKVSPDGQRISCEDRRERISYVGQQHFYHDGNPPTSNKQTLRRITEIFEGREIVDDDVVKWPKQ